MDVTNVDETCEWRDKDSTDAQPMPAGAISELARRALREMAADETKDQSKKLTRDLVLARLAMPGAESYLDREDRLFEGLVHSGWIAAKARQMGAGDACEDVQQRVLLRLMIDFREGRLYGISRGYVETTVGFDLKSQWRKAWPAELSEEAELALTADDEFPDSDLIDACAKIDRVWRSLTDRERRVLSWRFPGLLTQGSEMEAGDDRQPAEEKTLKEISAILKQSIATIHRLERASVARFLSGLCEEGLNDLADRLAKSMT